MILSYSYMRERIINDNNLTSYEKYVPQTINGTKKDADDYFKDKSMKIEQ